MNSQLLHEFIQVQQSERKNITKGVTKSQNIVGAVKLINGVLILHYAISCVSRPSSIISIISGLQEPF